MIVVTLREGENAVERGERIGLFIWVMGAWLHYVCIICIPRDSLTQKPLPLYYFDDLWEETPQETLGGAGRYDQERLWRVGDGSGV